RPCSTTMPACSWQNTWWPIKWGFPLMAESTRCSNSYEDPSLFTIATDCSLGLGIHSDWNCYSFFAGYPPLQKTFLAGAACLLPFLRKYEKSPRWRHGDRRTRPSDTFTPFLSSFSPDLPGF